VEVLQRRGRRAVVKVDREELVVLEFVLDAHANGAGPHFHRRHVDSFYVIAGELEVTVDGEAVRAHRGDLVHAPPEVVHSFGNASANAVRFVNIHAPGMRFVEYMRRMDAGDDIDLEEYDMFEVESS
jgi:quercetin dioxygenase-like cupin family protein